MIDSALGLESWVCNILICTFRCDFHGSSWYESLANLPPVLLTLPVPCPVFLNVQHYFWYHCSPDGSTWALDTCSLPLILLLSFTSLLSPFPLLELSACASHVLQVVVRNSCISSSGRLLGLGTIIGLLTSLSTYCIYLVTMIMIMSRGTGFFLVHSNYILLWRIEWIRKGGKNLSPDLHAEAWIWYLVSSLISFQI